jgi:hypothetical protein
MKDEISEIYLTILETNKRIDILMDRILSIEYKLKTRRKGR